MYSADRYEMKQSLHIIKGNLNMSEFIAKYKLKGVIKQTMASHRTLNGLSQIN